MLPTHLTRMLHACIISDYADPAVREFIQSQCIPVLSRHRREILSGNFGSRHALPGGNIEQVVTTTRLIRRVLQYAHHELTLFGACNNVVSLRAAAERRAKRC